MLEVHKHSVSSAFDNWILILIQHQVNVNVVFLDVWSTHTASLIYSKQFSFFICQTDRIQQVWILKGFLLCIITVNKLNHLSEEFHSESQACVKEADLDCKSPDQRGHVVLCGSWSSIFYLHCILQESFSNHSLVQKGSAISSTMTWATDMQHTHIHIHTLITPS